MRSPSIELFLGLALLGGCLSDPDRVFDNLCDPLNGGACGVDAGPPEAGPDAASPDAASPDAAPPDATPADATAADAAEPDSHVAGDAGPLCEACSQCRPNVCPYGDPILDPNFESATLGQHTVVQAEPTIRGTVIPGELRLANIDGDPNDTAETVVIRGGRVEAYNQDGSLRWWTAAIGALSLRGRVDLHFDDRPEILVNTIRPDAALVAIDGRSGAIRWSLSPETFDQCRPGVGVDALIAADLDGDRREDLYLTESGCATAAGGTGRGMSLLFPEEVGPPSSRSPMPQHGHSCGRQQVLARLDPMRPPQVVMPGVRSIVAVDPRLEEADDPGRHCGVSLCDGCAPGMALLATDLDADERDEVIASSAGAVFVLEGRDRQPEDAVVDCVAPDAASRVLAPRWRFDVPAGGELSPFATTAAALCEGGRQVLVTWEADEGSRTAILSSGGEQLGEPIPGRLLAVVALDPTHPSLVLQDGPRLRLQQLDPQSCVAEAEPLWSRPGSLLRRVPTARRAHQSRFGADDTHPPIVLEAVGDAPRRLLVVREAAEDEEGAYILEAIDRTGEDILQVGLPSPPVAADADCGFDGCERAAGARMVAIATEIDSGIRVFDAALSPVGAVRDGTAGTASLFPVGDPAEILAVSRSGVAARLEPAGTLAEAPVSLGLTRARRSSLPMRLGEVQGVLLRDFGSPNEIAWTAIAFGADGAREVWRHAEPAQRFGARQPARVGVTRVDDDLFDDLLRYEKLEDSDAALDCGGAPPTLVDARGAGCPPLPDERLPGPNEKDMVVTAISGADPTRCLWRTVLAPCGLAQGYEHLSVVPGADGPRVLVTHRTGISELDPRTGRWLGTAVFPDWPLRPDQPGWSLRGSRGGWVVSTGDLEVPYVVVGGNGPPLGLRDDLTWFPRAPIPCAPANLPAGSPTAGDGCGSQSWVDAEVAVVLQGDSARVWTTMGRSLPLAIIDPRGGVDPTYLGLLDGERIDASHPFSAGCLEACGVAACAPFAQVNAIVPVDDLLAEGQPGVLVGAEDGFLYALSTNGDLVWRRDFGSPVGRPVVLDVDGDDRLELLVPLADGRVLLLDDRGVPPPVALWDVEPDSERPCGPTGDLEVTDCREILCGAWTSVPDRPQYWVRAVGPNGVPITEWSQHSPDFVDVCLTGLSLEPGVRYRLEVRSRTGGEGISDFSRVVSSNGVTVSSRPPPELPMLRAPDCLGLDEHELVSIRVSAGAGQQLANWTLDVLDEQRRLVRRLVPRPEGLDDAGLNTSRDWDLEDDEGRRIEPDRYRLRLTVTNASGRSASTEAWLRVTALQMDCR